MLTAELHDDIIAKARGIDFFRDVFVVRKLAHDGVVPAGSACPALGARNTTAVGQNMTDFSSDQLQIINSLIAEEQARQALYRVAVFGRIPQYAAGGRGGKRERD